MAGPGRGLSTNPISRLFASRREQKFPGENAGWAATRTSATGRRGGLPRRLADYLGTYGGTEDSITWVYACVKLIASEAASYPYEIIEEDGDIIAEGEVDDDLQTLLDFPNPQTTYFDFVAYTLMDLELAGNSYWVKDERNGLGQPKALYRMRPDLVQVATDKQGKVVGFVYSIEGQQIPFDLDEVLRFMYPNPLDDRYGMGTVEAIQRALGAELSETEHINGFFSDGARISGILTTFDNLSDLQFERLRSEFEAQFKQGGNNNFGVLIAEQGTGYTPLSAVPAGSGVTELRRMGKDEILSGFGVPEFLLGGIGQGGIYKMSEAQHIFTRNMKPRSRRFSERMTMDLVSLWEGYEFRQDVTVAEPSETKLANAQKLMGMGASLNQILDQAGLPPIDDEQADEPLIQQGVLPFSIAIKQAQANLPPEPGADQFGGGGGFDPFGGFGGGGFGGGGGSFDEELDQFVAGRRGMRAPRPKSRTRNRVFHEAGAKAKDAIPAPELPIGFEQIGHVKAAHTDQQTMQHILQHHARVLKSGYPDLLAAIREFFVDQRKRVISRLPAAEKRVGTSHMRYPRKDISMDNLWDDDVENNALLDVYMQIVDEVGGKAVEAGRIIGSALSWDLTNPLIAEAREDLGKLIVRINEKTREDIAGVVETGMRNGYSVPQIAQGYPKENYPGIQGVFDQASAARAETIARTETARIYNAAANASYEEAGVTHVEVIDGDGDAACKAANGSKWTLEHAKANPTQHPNAVMAGTRVLAVGEVSAAYGAEWNGPVVVVRTAGASQLTVGPNHPVLTRRGWVAAGELRVGDDVVRRLPVQRSLVTDIDLDQVEPAVEDVLASLGEIGDSTRVVAVPDHFHGDGNFCEGEVEVVWTERTFELGGDSLFEQEIAHQGGERADAEAETLPGHGPHVLGGGAVTLAAPSRLSLGDVRGVIVPAAQHDVAFAEAFADDRVSDTDFLRELAGRLSVEVALDKVVEVRYVDSWAGHAFDLQTDSSMYFAEGILVHNCVRSFAPIIDVRKAIKELPAARWDPRDHPRDRAGRFADSPSAGAREAFVRTARDAVDGWDHEYGITTKGPTLKRFKEWIGIWLTVAAVLAERQLDKTGGGFRNLALKLAEFHERLEGRKLSPLDFFEYSTHAEEFKHMAEHHHLEISEILDEAFILAGEAISVTPPSLIDALTQLITKDVTVIDTKASIRRLLPDGTPDPDFEERLHPRGPGGRFRDKPDVPKPVRSRPNVAKDDDDTASSKPKPRLGSREDLELLGVPKDVIAQIEELGLDENLKKRKKGDTAKRLLGSAEDTKQLHSDKRTGAYSAKRKELHDRIVDLMLREKKPVFNAEKGFVEWELDPEGEYVGTPEVMKQRLVDKIAAIDTELAKPEADAEAPRLRAERDAYRAALNNIGARKKALFLAGGNASGKSTALYSKENQDVMKPGPDNVEINFDLIKERIPEFQQMAAAHDIYGTDGTHFESADIARRLMEEANQRGTSVIVDASGDSRTTGFQDTIRDHKRMGYDTEVLMVDAPVEIALRDSIKRALKTGRYIPAPILRNIHANSVARFDEWKEDGAIDKWSLYRRTDDGVVKAAEGGQGAMKVLADGAYRGILDKKNDAQPLKTSTATKVRQSTGRIAEGTPVPDPDSPEVINVGDDVVKAAELIAKGVPVELDSPRVVSTLLDKLAEMVEDAIAKGDKAPTYDLCRVTVKGTNLFCVESKGIPRIQMPQLKGVAVAGSRAAGLTPDRRGEVDITPQFKEYLAGKGIGIRTGEESAAYMKATQNELDGAKVAGIAKFLDGGGVIEGENILLSKDGYIVDGHHRWAAVVGLDARDNELGNDVPMGVDFIDLDIFRVLREANRFAADWGLPQQSVADDATNSASGK